MIAIWCIFDKFIFSHAPLLLFPLQTIHQPSKITVWTPGVQFVHTVILYQFAGNANPLAAFECTQLCFRIGMQLLGNILLASLDVQRSAFQNQFALLNLSIIWWSASHMSFYKLLISGYSCITTVSLSQCKLISLLQTTHIHDIQTNINKSFLSIYDLIQYSLAELCTFTIILVCKIHFR